MKTSIKYLIGLLLVAGAFYAWFLYNKKQDAQWLLDNGDQGGNGGDNGNQVADPSIVPFRDFANMRYIGNDGRNITESLTTLSKAGTRLRLDRLFNATGFVVPAEYDLSKFIIGEPVKVSTAPIPSAPSTPPVGTRDREELNRQLLQTTAGVHYDTGIQEILAIVPAIPGHGTDIRGHWVVTDGTSRTGSTDKEAGTLTSL